MKSLWKAGTKVVTPVAAATLLAGVVFLSQTKAESTNESSELPSRQEEATLETILLENTPLRGFEKSRDVDVTGCTITIVTKYDRSCSCAVDCGGGPLIKGTNIYGLRELSEEGPEYRELPKRSQPKLLYSPPPSFRPSSDTHSLTWNVSPPIQRIVIDARAEIDKLLNDEEFFTTEWNDRKPRLLEADRHAFSVLDENGIVTRSTREDCDGFVSYETVWALYMTSSHKSVVQMGHALTDYRDKYCKPQQSYRGWWWPW